MLEQIVSAERIENKLHVGISCSHPGQPVFETIKRDPGYGNWVLRGNFPPHVKAIISAALKMKQEEFLAFVKAEFGEG